MRCEQSTVLCCCNRPDCLGCRRAINAASAVHKDQTMLNIRTHQLYSVLHPNTRPFFAQLSPLARLYCKLSSVRVAALLSQLSASCLCSLLLLFAGCIGLLTGSEGTSLDATICWITGRLERFESRLRGLSQPPFGRWRSELTHRDVVPLINHQGRSPHQAGEGCKRSCQDSLAAPSTRCLAGKRCSTGNHRGASAAKGPL